MSLVSFDGYVIDCSITETHKHDSEVTEFPTESGANLTDHIRPKPIEVTVEGVVSDTPLAAVQLFRETGEVPSKSALEKFLKIRSDRLPIPIVTLLKAYENMAMTSLEIGVSSDKSGGLWFTASFRQIEIVTNDRAKRVADPRGQGGNKIGGDGKRIGFSSGEVLWRHGSPNPGDPFPPNGRTELVFFDDTGPVTNFEKVSREVNGRGANWYYSNRVVHGDNGVQVHLPLLGPDFEAFSLDRMRDLRDKQAELDKFFKQRKIGGLVPDYPSGVDRNGRVSNRGGQPQIPKGWAGTGGKK